MHRVEPFRPRGRPRAFNEEKALDGAVALFAEVGFSAAAVSDLTNATGLSVGSLYKAYRDKDGVFQKALDRYVAVRDAAIGEALADKESGRERLRAILNLYATLSQGEIGRRGCLVVAAVAELDVIGEAAADVVRSVLSRRRDMLTGLVAAGQHDGSIAISHAPRLVADLLLNVVQGMRVRRQGGLFPENAGPLIELALTMLD